MFVARNSQRQFFDRAKFRLQQRLELHLCFFDVFGLCKCLLQEFGRFKPDAERLRPAVKSDRKEWSAGETICGGRETKIAFAAGSGLTNRYHCFSGTERGLTVNTSLG